MSRWDYDYLKKEFEEFRLDYPGLKRSEQYELFTASIILKNFDYEPEALENGRTGIGTDGGVDWIYFAVNDQIVGDLSEFDAEKIKLLNSGFDFEVLIGQAKEVDGFKGGAGESLNSTLGYLFDDEENKKNPLPGQFSDELVTKIAAFKEFYFRARSKRPVLKFSIYYCTDSLKDPHSNVKGSFSIAEGTIKRIFSNALVDPTHFCGIDDMMQRWDFTPSYDTDLRYMEEADLSTGKVALVTLADYYDFLCNESGEINEHFFASNVRDYEGAVQVNNQIAETLEDSEPKTDFWWLNNGITILVSAPPVSQTKTYTLKNVQVVNGLQTSYSIYNYFKSNPHKLKTDNRAVMIRVISSDDETEKLKVIKATNSQTMVPKASLRATDPVHLDIEKALKLDNLYYERRKNFYKNQKIKPRDIVSITSLSQSALSAFLQRPDTARARPSSFLNNDDQYREIFEDRSMEEFRWSARADKLVRTALDSSSDYSPTEKANLKFYILMILRILGHYDATGDTEWRTPGCRNDWNATTEQIQAAGQWVKQIATQLLKSGDYANLDVLCKGPDLLSALEISWADQSAKELREEFTNLGKQAQQEQLKAKLGTV